MVRKAVLLQQPLSQTKSRLILPTDLRRKQFLRRYRAAKRPAATDATEGIGEGKNPPYFPDCPGEKRQHTPPLHASSSGTGWSPAHGCVRGSRMRSGNRLVQPSERMNRREQPSEIEDLKERLSTVVAADDVVLACHGTLASAIHIAAGTIWRRYLSGC